MKIELIHTLSGHNSSVYKLIPGEDNTFYSLAGDGYLVRWNKNDENGILVAKADEHFYSGCFVSKNILVTGSFSGQVYWFDTNEQVIIKRVQHHRKAVFNCLYTNDGLFTASEDGYLTFWNTEKMHPDISVKISPYGLRALSLLEDKSLAIGDMNGSIYIVNHTNLEITDQWNGHEKTVFKILQQGTSLFTCGRDAMLRQWYLPDRSLLKEIPAHWYTINDMLFFENNLITTSRDKKIRIWDSELQLLQSIDVQQGGHVNSVNSVIVLSDQKTVVTCSDDRSIKVWSILE